MRIVVTNCALVGLALLCRQASATVIYDNGPYDEGGALEISFVTGADDFVLGANETATGASFVFRDIDGSPWDGSTLNWFVYSDGGGAPGATLASGAGTNFNITNLGPSVFPDKTLLEVEFDFGVGVALSGGTTYWFGLNTFGSPNGAQWLSSQTTTGSTSAISFGGGWTHAAGDVNFKLQAAVPAPPTWPLIGFSLLGLYYYRKRGARSTAPRS